MNLPLFCSLFILSSSRSLPLKRHVERSNTYEEEKQRAVRQLEDTRLRDWEDENRRRLNEAERMQAAEEHWNRYPISRRGGCKGRRYPSTPGPHPQRRRCQYRYRTPHDASPPFNPNLPPYIPPYPLQPNGRDTRLVARSPCPALKTHVLEGRSFEDIVRYALSSGCTQEEAMVAVDLARRRREKSKSASSSSFRYPVLFFSKWRGWVKVYSDEEKRIFEEQEAESEITALRGSYPIIPAVEEKGPTYEIETDRGQKKQKGGEYKDEEKMNGINEIHDVQVAEAAGGEERLGKEVKIQPADPHEGAYKTGVIIIKPSQGQENKENKMPSSSDGVALPMDDDEATFFF